MTEEVIDALGGLVSFNNFYYCRSDETYHELYDRLVSFNNFYYCR